MAEDINYDRRRFLGAAALTIAAAHAGPAQPQLPMEGRFPSLNGATAWLNSPPLKSSNLKGKVVLIDFWTYT